MSSACACPRNLLVSEAFVDTAVLSSLEGVRRLLPLDGEMGGVDCRKVDGDAGDSGLRNGELLGEPYPKGEGL